MLSNPIGFHKLSICGLLFQKRFGFICSEMEVDLFFTDFINVSREHLYSLADVKIHQFLLYALLSCKLAVCVKIYALICIWAIKQDNPLEAEKQMMSYFLKRTVLYVSKVG